MSRRRTAAVLVVALLCVTMPVAPALAQAGTDSAPVSDGVRNLVDWSPPDSAATYGPDGDPALFVEYAEGEGGSLSDWANNSEDRVILQNDTDDRRALVRLPPEDTGFSLLAGVLDRGIANRPYVTDVELDYTVTLTRPVALESASQWTNPRSSAEQIIGRGEFGTDGVAFSEDAEERTLAEARATIDADGVAANGEGVRVAVLDTGINTDEGTVFGNGNRGSDIRVAASKNLQTNETGLSAVQDGNGHGTWVAAAIAADTEDADYRGVAPNATLLVGKVLDDEGQGSTADIAEGVEWAGQNGADIISMSLGAQTYSETVAEEIRDFLSSGGSAVIIAAGNNRQTTRYVTSPADVPEAGVVTVAATNAPDETDRAESAYFSATGPDHGADGSDGATRGQRPDVAAPGMRIEAELPSGTRTLSGTSMATPLVAGAVALQLDANPGLEGEPASVAGYVGNTSTVLPRAGVTEVGSGMVDAGRLVTTNPTDQDQAANRNDDARARDRANRAFAGSYEGWFAPRRFGDSGLFGALSAPLTEGS